MKIIDMINGAVEQKKSLFAFELLPPLKGETINTIYNAIDPLVEFNPSYINVTHHREDIKYIERADGLLERRIVKKRPGTIGISAAIMARYNIEVAPHLICGGWSKYDIEDALIEMNFLGIHNVLALRGDASAAERCFKPHKEGYSNASELVAQIADMNRGVYIDSEIENSTPTEFCTGVAGYPEKHSEAPNLQTDISYLKKKVESGADYIVTQLFYDNNKYFTFVEECRKAGITVPIIAGLKPFSTKSQLAILPQTFHVDLPEELVLEVVKCKDNSAVRQVGIEWAVQQCKELKAAGVPVIHFYTMGRPDNVVAIAKQVF